MLTARLVLISVLVSAVLLTTPNYLKTASAADVEVTVTIERVIAKDDLDGDGSEADFYFDVYIDGVLKDNEDTVEQDALEDHDDITPAGWAPVQTVDSSKGTIGIVIQIWDEDDFIAGDDDLVDIDQGGNSQLDLSINLFTCEISGDVSGSCGTTIITSGTPDDYAEIWFSIIVEDPAAAPGLRIQCIHSPIWPLTGDIITITARALDDSLNPKNLNDVIEIWVNDKSAPAVTGGGSTLTYTVGPFDGSSSFAYGCRAIDDGVRVFTGWRVVKISHQNEPAVPILYNGHSSGAIDIVFIPDEDTYSSSADVNFLSDVAQSIGAYYNEDVYLVNQKMINFWIARDTTGDVRAAKCGDSEPPDNWDDDYAFADAGAIVHRLGGTFRDCAIPSERIFTGDATRLDAGLPGRVFLHETGHQPFGLADEYCNTRPGSSSTVCDGGYFQADPFPNLYQSLAACQADPDNAGKTCEGFITTKGGCSAFDEADLDGDGCSWFTADPASIDLMVDNLLAEPLDVRRINWMFSDVCSQTRC